MSNRITTGTAKTYYLSLGSNLGDRQANLDQGIRFLKEIGDIKKVSAIYETEPVGMDQETRNFFNLTLMVQSTITESEMLTAIKKFEQLMGRDISNSHYQPRTIDIDILMVETMDIENNKIQGCIMNRTDLIIPHKELYKRAFVLVPLNEIAPGAMHPVLNKPISQILKELKSDEIVIKRLSVFPS
jgi:2-amino-4-hydroxy-6-hydroxymethyldihydropteridine diphosphokinase